MSDRNAVSRKGRRAGLVIAGTGVFWVLVTLIGEKEGFSTELRIAFDLLALAGFLFAFWLIYQIWRDSRGN